MAVIKIVPMPGAVGDKGDEGAPGATGPQGQQGIQGLPGADALWSYNGAWQANAAYAIGDLVTYQGQLYYAKAITTAGTLPTDTTKFDLIAAKGADGEVLQTDSISGTWDTKFAELNGIDVGDATRTSYRYYNNNKMGSYHCVGDLVFFDFRMLLGDPVSWGTASQWKFQLPFPVYYESAGLYGSNEGTLRNTLNRSTINGWLRHHADVDPTPMDGMLSETNTYGDNELHHILAQCILRTYPLDTETGLYTGGYASTSLWPAEDPKVGVAFIVASQQDGDEPFQYYGENTNTIGYKDVNATWPSNLVQALADNNDGIPANNASTYLPQGKNQNVIQFHFTGVYRKTPTNIQTEIDQYIQGPQGPVGPQGPAGVNGQDGQDGAPGATPFTLVGAYDNGVSYNLGIAVYYNGGTYVRTGNPLNPGYPPTLGAINESWTPIAEKGADAVLPTGATGSFVSQDGKTVTVTNGIITSIV